MSTHVDLSLAKSEDEVLLIWARYLLGEVMRQRENQEEALTSRIYVFEKNDDGVSILPTRPDALLGLPSRPEPALAVLGEKAVGYLVMLPTAPIPEAAWAGLSPVLSKEQSAGIPLSVPTEILPFDKPYTLWLSAAFYSQTIERTFCAGLLDDKFSELKEIDGSFGGSLANLRGIGIRTA